MNEEELWLFPGFRSSDYCLEHTPWLFLPKRNMNTAYTRNSTTVFENDELIYLVDECVNTFATISYVWQLRAIKKDQDQVSDNKTKKWYNTKIVFLYDIILKFYMRRER